MECAVCIVTVGSLECAVCIVTEDCATSRALPDTPKIMDAMVTDDIHTTIQGATFVRNVWLGAVPQRSYVDFIRGMIWA